MGNCVKSLFPSIKWSRRRTVELAILTVLAVTSSILILVLPSSRVYCVIVLCLVVIYGARLWRLLPSDRRRVSKEAHALADAVLRARQAVGTFPSLAQSMHPPQPQAHSMCTPQQPQSLFAGSVQAPYSHMGAMPAEQLLAVSMAQSHQAIMAASMRQQQQKHQQAMLAASMSQQQQLLIGSPMPEQQVLMTSFPSQQQPVMNSFLPQQPMMLTPVLPPQQVMLASNISQSRQMHGFSPRSSPMGPYFMGGGNVLPQLTPIAKSAVRYG